MATLSENLQTLSTVKTEIKTAIESKGQNLTNVPFTEYASKINSIQTGNPEFTTKLLNRTLTEVIEQDLKGITQISPYIFASCKNLVNVDLPDSINIINDYAFKGCTLLPRLYLPKNIMYLSTGVFQGCSTLDEVTLPPGITVLLGYTFDGCKSLTSIDLSNIKEMSTAVFLDCSNLANVVFGDKLTTIGANVFMRCTSLNNIILPNSLTRIQTNAFNGCTSLDYVELPEVPPTLAAVAAFGNVSPSCIFYCPTADSLAAYQTATNWSSLASTYTFMVKE